MTEQLNPDAIAENTSAKRIADKIIVYNSTSSTNDIAWQYVDSTAENCGVVVFAEHQSAGRGRRGHRWLDKSGLSVMFSILLKGKSNYQQAITLACAVAVAKTLEEFCVGHIRVKWPNDILVDGKKIAGILTECRGDDLVIGIGVNCHQKQDDFDIEIANIATSLDIATDAFNDRNIFAGLLLTNLDSWVYQAENNSSSVVDSWLGYCVLIGMRIGIRFGQDEFYGNCIGIDPQNGLILQIEGGGVRMFSAACSSLIQ